ncbi:MAG: 50S ribosomal protein L13 [Candidatus Magasanikbacteria bacterium]|nr:50S ribosomal protein L13 [Candidatus Magasanikbacteria bacterium]
MAKRKTIEIDATGQAPGRLATKIATILMGKHKVKFTPHIDYGDKVVITNYDKIVFTGKKLEQKLYRHHSNHPGGLKEVPAKKIMAEKPQEAIRSAVIKMLPKNKLRDQRMIRLHFKK